MPPASSVSTDDTIALRFGRFEIQPGERLLLSDGHPVSLGARAFDLLATLAARPGHLITKSDLLDLVWPGLVVEESNLHTQISTLRRILGSDAITTVPGRGYRFVAETEVLSLPPTTVQPSAGAAVSTSLPTVHGRLFGRDDDLVQLARALETPGCVTLVGAGGVGKTRLALAAASRWKGRCHWADLSPLTDGTQVAGALARAAGLTLADGEVGARLVDALGNEPMLLVLDNAEHVIGAVSAVAELLLRGQSQLRLLVTSQVPLSIAGERVRRIDPLRVERDDAPGDGAMALLIERISAADHRVRMGADALPLLREIAHQLDGLPLALEMAAARVPLLGLEGVRDNLAQRFALLKAGLRHAAPRHRTLHAALDWSFGLLDGEERQLFAALGVFAGGFTLELCVALVSGETASRWDVIDRLASLADRSLVAVGGEDPPRYRLMETMRAYALEQLAVTGTHADHRRRHAEVVLAYLRARVSSEAGKRACLAELDNAREAIGWSTVHDLSLAAALTTCVVDATTFSAWRGQSHAWMLALEPRMRSAEGERIDIARRVAWWNEFARSSIIGMTANSNEIACHARAIAQTHDDPQAQLMAIIAVVRSLHEPSAKLDEARTALERLSVEHPDMSGRVRLASLGALAYAATAHEEHERVLELRLKEVALARAEGLDGAGDAAESNVITALVRLKRYDEAHRQSRALLGRLEGSMSLNFLWAWYGVVVTLVAMGRSDEAIPELSKALVACRHLQHPILTSLFCAIANAQERHAASALLAGFVRAAFEQRRVALFGPPLEIVETSERDAAVALSSAERDVLVQRGRELDEKKALALLSDSDMQSEPRAIAGLP